MTLRGSVREGVKRKYKLETDLGNWSNESVQNPSGRTVKTISEGLQSLVLIPGADVPLSYHPLKIPSIVS
jgi:hypothetical protein